MMFFRPIKDSYPKPMVIDEKKSQVNTIDLVLDIDDTLVCSLEAKSSFIPSPETANEHKKYPLLKWFEDNDMLINANQLHILHPGADEFIKHLIHHPNIRKLTFFSSAPAERNELLVSKLLLRACDNDEDLFQKLIKEKINIHYKSNKMRLAFSQDDLTPHEDCPADQVRARFKKYRISAGKMYKDLRKVLLKKASLDSTILIDDVPSYIYPGQEKNHLRINYASKSVFESICRSKTLQQDDQDEIEKTNHLFYVTAFLERLFHMGDNFNNFIENMFQLQFEKVKSELSYDHWDYHEYSPRNPSDKDKAQLFLEGRRLLKKFNPKLNFFGGSEAESILTASIAKEESCLTISEPASILRTTQRHY